MWLDQSTRTSRLVKKCNQCGKCCINYANGGLSASPEEIEKWETHRPDIAEFVRNGKIWMDPATGKRLKHCPWLEREPGQRRYQCTIYYDRPDDCRYYPVHVVQMIRDECEMLEKSDLKHIELAQRKLDELMSDSRPPVSD